MHKNSHRSRTAEGTAALRAAGAREHDPDLRNPDHLAERLIGRKYRLGVRIAPIRAMLLWDIERRMPGLYGYITARTKHMDRLLVEDVRAGARQVVILGAGADSRAYRLTGDLATIPVFEVDHPMTGAWKQNMLGRLLGRIPDHVHFISVDFGTRALRPALEAAGVDRTIPTVFLWEGVTPYLVSDDIDATLDDLAYFVSGSSIIFDYWHRDAFDHPCPYPEGDKYIRELAAREEPVRSGLDPAMLATYLAEHGWHLVDNTQPAALARQYLPGSTRKVLSLSSIAHARLR